MSEWHETAKGIHPLEGLKVLCMHKGDFYVAQKIGEIYAPIPLCDSVFAKDFIKPEKWQYIDFPDGYSGFLKFGVEGEDEFIVLEALKNIYPEDYQLFCDGVKKTIYGS